jgi:predicted  nucleic acid-binding Zn-ribbon protein
MLVLTDEDIQEDIRGFEQRIQDARGKLSELPETDGTWQAGKKLADKRRVLESEIEHVKRLIGIAEEALTDV